MDEFENKYKKMISEKYDFGTGVCTAVTDKIKMKFNTYGEYIPSFDDNSSNLTDEEIKKVNHTSMSLSKKSEKDVSRMLFGKIPEIRYDSRLGYYSSLYVGYVKEGNYRENGSSGGFATWIFKELFEKKYIDYVIHIKATEKKEKLFEYAVSSNIDEIINGAKTRYYPVELSEVLEIVKKIPGKYAVIGLPSYIMELRLLSEIDTIIDQRIRFMIGLVCGHQKSTKFADLLAWQCGIEPGNLKYINFRKKIESSPSSSYGIEVVGDINGEEQTITRKMSDLYGGDWGKGLFKVRASDFTDDVMNETADITLGDAWLPEYTTDPKGNNIVIIRNSIIDNLVKEALDGGKVSLDKVSADKIFQSQESHYRHTKDELSYRLYKKQYKKEWFPQKRVLPSKDIGFIRRRIQDVREMICLNAPTYFNEAVRRKDLNFFIKKMRMYDNFYRILYKIQGIKKRIIK